MSVIHHQVARVATPFRSLTLACGRLARRNLTHYDEGSGLFYLKTDASNVVPPDARGRDSIRLHSNLNFTGGVFIASALHMPEGCGTWPAWWLTNDPWPKYGEVDIIENINREGRNSFVGHTEGYCDAPAPQDTFQGVWKPFPLFAWKPSTDCTLENNRQGCAAHMPPGTASAPFNSQGGGTYALVWDDSGLRVYFWSNSCGGAPEDILNNSPVPNTWGLPMARFDFSQDKCLPERYQQLHMVINLTFCGTWAGAAGWAQCLDKGFDCDSYVRGNPSDFEDAYWAFEYIKVFTLRSSPAGSA